MISTRFAQLTFGHGVVAQPARAGGFPERPRRSEQQRVVQFLHDLHSPGPRLLEHAESTCHRAPAFSTVLARGFRGTHPRVGRFEHEEPDGRGQAWQVRGRRRVFAAPSLPVNKRRLNIALCLVGCNSS